MSSWENWVTEPSVEYVSRSMPEPMEDQNSYNYPYYIQGGGAFAQEIYVVDTGAQEGEKVACVRNCMLKPDA